MSVRDPGCLSRATVRCVVSSYSLFERFEVNKEEEEEEEDRSVDGSMAMDAYDHVEAVRP